MSCYNCSQYDLDLCFCRERTVAYQFFRTTNWIFLCCVNSFLPKVMRNLRGFGPSRRNSRSPQGFRLLIRAQRMMCGLGARHKFELCRRQNPGLNKRPQEPKMSSGVRESSFISWSSRPENMLDLAICFVKL
ncbi:hypothetical protein H5410_057235 [Solanum commersonii]|uniref:Uncharacterized protein n=1 Tax=Solanum commersonii TaxID=4109 RepID=A0A9J5WP35_SOLCO|nr:hypothetical protein H5410_057235 [Solanum commersonii]